METLAGTTSRLPIHPSLSRVRPHSDSASRGPVLYATTAGSAQEMAKRPPDATMALPRVHRGGAYGAGDVLEGADGMSPPTLARSPREGRRRPAGASSARASTNTLNRAGREARSSPPLHGHRGPRRTALLRQFEPPRRAHLGRDCGGCRGSARMRERRPSERLPWFHRHEGHRGRARRDSSGCDRVSPTTHAAPRPRS